MCDHLTFAVDNRGLISLEMFCAMQSTCQNCLHVVRRSLRVAKRRKHSLIGLLSHPSRVAPWCANSFSEWLRWILQEAKVVGLKKFQDRKHELWLCDTVEVACNQILPTHSNSRSAKAAIAGVERWAGRTWAGQKTCLIQFMPWTCALIQQVVLNKSRSSYSLQSGGWWQYPEKTTCAR